MAKALSIDEAVLAGLRKAVEALPERLVLTGSGGVFGPKKKDLAAAAVAQGFLTREEETVKTGKKPKKVVYGVLTEKGIKRVLDADSPKAALEAILPAVEALSEQPQVPTREEFRAELAKASEKCVNAISEVCSNAIKKAFDKLEAGILKALTPAKEAFDDFEEEVLQALAPPSGNSVDASVVLKALQQTLERVEGSTGLPGPSRGSTAESSNPPATVGPQALDEAIVAFVDGWAKEKTIGCRLDILWDYLKARFPDLTIGAFQDSLRKLHEAERIRLSGWGRMLDEMPQPHLALFVSSKVMYYAQPGH